MPIVLPSKFTRQPQYAAPLDLGNPITQRIVGAGYFNVDSGGPPLSLTGTVTTTPTARGMAIAASGSGNYAQTNRLYTPSTLNGTVMIFAVPVSLANTIGFIHTSTSSNYRGFHVTCSTAGVLTVAYGNAGGNATTNRRFWDVTSYTTTAGTPFCLAYAVDSSTVSRIWIDGLVQTSTAGGSASSYDPGTGATALLRRVAGTALGNKQLMAWAVWDRSLTDAELRSITLNPWQLWCAPQRQFWVWDVGNSNSYTISGDASAGADATGAILKGLLITGNASAVADASGATVVSKLISGDAGATGTTTAAIVKALLIAGNTEAAGATSGNFFKGILISGGVAGTGSTSEPSTLLTLLIQLNNLLSICGTTGSIEATNSTTKLIEGVLSAVGNISLRIIRGLPPDTVRKPTYGRLGGGGWRTRKY